MDAAHVFTDKTIESIDKEIEGLYRQAMKDLKEELKKVEADIVRMQSSGAEKQELIRLINKKERTEKMISKMAYRIENANSIAMKILNDENLNVFSENFNFSMFTLQKQSGFKIDYTVFNENIIKQFLDENRNILTEISVDNLKDYKNLKREIKQIFFANLMNGENINTISKNLQKFVNKNMNKTKMIVRTEVTRTENFARIEAFSDGEKMGLEIEKTWIATMDNRTRKSHRNLNGETKPIDEPFSNGLMYPAADGEADEVIGCRCTMTSEFVGFKKHALEKELDEQLKNVAWETWKNE